jgi:DNA repair photolyase
MSVIYKPAGRAGEYAEWAVNLFGGCEHGCVYCYVPAARHIDRSQFYAEQKPYNDILNKLAADCEKFRGQIKTPILLSFTSDVAQPSFDIRSMAGEAIAMLKESDFSVCILTKGGTRAVEFFPLLDGRDIIASSLTLANEVDSVRWEPNGALPNDRIELLRLAKNAGMQTWASFEPVIFPDQSFEMMKRSAAVVDLVKIGSINYHPQKATIDWPAFCSRAVELCRSLNVPYYLKAELMKIVGESFEQTWNPLGKVKLHAS